MNPEELGLPEPEEPVDEVTPDELRGRIDAGDDVTVLDTRMESEYHEWRIEDDNVESVNIPYFEFLDDEIDEEVLARVPEDRRLTAVCAKGGASEYVAGALQKRGYDVEHLVEGMEGWASIYDAVEVKRYDGEGTLVQYQRPSSGCLGYMVVDGDEAAVIDPLRAFADRYIEDARDRGAELVYAVDTHVHADHVSGVRVLDSKRRRRRHT